MAIPSMGGAIPNLRDNINDAFKDFKINDFIETVESNEFTKELPGIQDLLMAIKKGLDALLKLINLILTIIEFIMAILDWLFGKGVEGLLSFILDLIGGIIGGFGLTLGQRAEIMDMITDNCVEFKNNNNRGWNFNILDMIVISALIISLACSDDETGYSQIYNTYITSGAFEEVRSDIHTIEVEIENFTTDPSVDALIAQEAAYQAELNAAMIAINDQNIIDIRNIIADLENRISVLERQYSDYLNGVTIINTTIINININNTSPEDLRLRDIYDIEREIEELRSEVAVNRADLDALIVALGDANINALLDNLETIRGDIEELKELTMDPRERTLRDRLNENNKLLADLLTKANLMFASIGKTVIVGLTTNGKTTPDSLVGVLHDITTTQPGYLIGGMYNDLSIPVIGYIERTFTIDQVIDLEALPMTEREQNIYLQESGGEGPYDIDVHFSFTRWLVDNYRRSFENTGSRLQFDGDIGRVVPHMTYDIDSGPRMSYSSFIRLRNALMVIDKTLIGTISGMDVTKTRRPGFQSLAYPLTRALPLDLNDTLTDRSGEDINMERLLIL